MEKYNFKKDKNVYYYISPIVLKRSNDFLTIYCEMQGEDIVLTDKAQLLMEYDMPIIDLDYLVKKAKNLAKKYNLINNNMSLCRTIKNCNVHMALSELIKSIVLIEKEMENLIN